MDHLSLKLRPVAMKDSTKLLRFELTNQSYFEQFVPPRPEGFLSKSGMEKSVDQLIEEMTCQTGAYFLLWREQEIVGRFNFEMGKSGAANLGYRLGQNQTGQGLATQGLKKAIARACVDIGIEKVHAETTPDNLASIRVLEKCGFSRTGITIAGGILHGQKVDLVQFQKICGNLA